MRYVEKPCGAGWDTYDNMFVSTACWIHKSANTHRICNVYCFSTV